VCESEAVEVALAEALAEAARAAQWLAVEVLARELEARRISASNLVQLDARRKRSRG
jgi:hypothetical protein